ncbi:MAG: hypothetical protein ABWZ53_07815 [Actinomycetota bacterium]
MNDVERDLRELLERKAGSVGTVAPGLPETVRKRGRLRQLATATIGAFTVAAIALASFAGLQAIDQARPIVPEPGGPRTTEYETFERTATIENLTITSPSDWYLVNQWPLGAALATTGASDSGSCEVTLAPGKTSSNGTGCSDGSVVPGTVAPMLVPILSLSNDDLGLGTSACAFGAFDVPDDTAILEILIDGALVDAQEAGDAVRLPAWPASFEGTSVEDGPCGRGHYARFQAGRYPFVAWAGFGPRVTEEDRRTLFRAFGSMDISNWTIRAPLSRDPAYVIAGGENAAGPWRLELRPSDRGGPDANVLLELVSAEGGIQGTGDFTVPEETPIEFTGGDPVFGAVTTDAAGVELRLEEGTPPIPATIMPMPPSLAGTFDVFFASNASDVPATAVALDADGDVIETVSGSLLFEASFDVQGYATTLTIEDRGGLPCYRVANDAGAVEGCQDEITLSSIPLSEDAGQVLVFSLAGGVRLSGMELDVDGGETIEAASCKMAVCVMGIPPGSGTGTLWLMQRGQRSDSDTIAWTPEGVERT